MYKTGVSLISRNIILETKAYIKKNLVRLNMQFRLAFNVKRGKNLKQTVYMEKVMCKK